MGKNTYSLFFSKTVNWKSFDIGILEKLLCTNLFVGFIDAISSIEFIEELNNAISSITFFYFIASPIFIYYRTFKTNESRYIFITPVKNSYVFLSSLKVIVIGFFIFMVLKVINSYMIIGHEYFTNNISIVHISVFILNFILVVVGFQMIIISIDVFANIKKAYKLIIYMLGLVIVFLRFIMPSFMVYSITTNIDIIKFFTAPNKIPDLNYFWMESSVDLGKGLVTLLVGIILFIIAMKNFELYSYERK